CATVRAENVKILQGPPVPSVVPTLPPMASSSTSHPNAPTTSSPSTAGSSAGMMSKGSLSGTAPVVNASGEFFFPVSLQGTPLSLSLPPSPSLSLSSGANVHSAIPVPNINGVPLTDAEQDNLIASLHPDTSPNRKRRVKTNQDNAPIKKRKVGKK
ncbi:14902_t:CDS:2, partial [Acaulospora colombiana]